MLKRNKKIVILIVIITVCIGIYYFLFFRSYPGDINEIREEIKRLVLLDRYREAARLGEIELKYVEEKYGSKHIETGISSKNLAECYFLCDEYPKAEKLCLKALDIFLDNYGEDFIEVLNIMKTLGDTYKFMHKLGESERFYIKALNGYRKKEDKKRMFSVLIELGDVYLMKKEYKRVEEKYREALDIAEDMKDMRKKLICFRVMRYFYRELGDKKKEEEMERKIKELERIGR